MLPGMGKSFISSNMAASIGLTGKKVILVDLDLRRGTMTRTFYSRKHAGLSNYLAGARTTGRTSSSTTSSAKASTPSSPVPYRPTPPSC